MDDMLPRCLLAIAGPTATGKTGLSLALAERLSIAILSADSRLVYRELDIGTAKPSQTERSQAPHYLIDIREPTETMTVAEYQRSAQTLIQQLHLEQERVPCLVGGTGLYISSVVDGLQIPRWHRSRSCDRSSNDWDSLSVTACCSKLIR